MQFKIGEITTLVDQWGGAKKIRARLEAGITDVESKEHLKELGLFCEF